MSKYWYDSKLDTGMGSTMLTFEGLLWNTLSFPSMYQKIKWPYFFNLKDGPLKEFFKRWAFGSKIPNAPEE